MGRVAGVIGDPPGFPYTHMCSVNKGLQVWNDMRAVLSKVPTAIPVCTEILKMSHCT